MDRNPNPDPSPVERQQQRTGPELLQLLSNEPSFSKGMYNATPQGLLSVHWCNKVHRQLLGVVRIFHFRMRCGARAPALREERSLIFPLSKIISRHFLTKDGRTVLTGLSVRRSCRSPLEFDSATRSSDMPAESTTSHKLGMTINTLRHVI